MIQKQTNQKAERIVRWRETLSTMNDERFFEIMRVYLGEIHTPFNKSNLIEQLSAIFRKEENKKTILAFLSDFDTKIISAIYTIKDCTQEKLLEFFKSEYLISDIYSELINLEERLIIYSYKDSETKQNIFALNPILEETLLKVINLKCLLPEPQFAERNYDVQFSISPNFIAAFYSFILENPGMCKNNAEIKKRDFDKLCQVFSGHENCIKLLLNSFINLGLVKLGEKELSVDKKRFKIFAELSEVEQYAFIATSSVTRLGRQSLQTQAQLLLNTLVSIPKEGLSLSNVFRIAFLIKYQKDRTTDFPTQSRFSKIIESYRSSPANSQNAQQILSDEIIENILRNSIEFGLLQEIGKDEKGNEIVIANEIFHNFAGDSEETSVFRNSAADRENARHCERSEAISSKKGIVNINAGTSIAILPGLSLKELLPITTFLNIVTFNTVCEFEITKKSIYRAFDSGTSAKEILSLLSEYNSYKIPQSLEMNIQEWENSYSSAIIYKGYVLKVDSKTERIIENNPKILPFIKLKLAEGIYLLNIPVEQEPSEFIEKSGLELLSAVKTPEQNVELAKFPILNRGKNYVDLQNNVVSSASTTSDMSTTSNSANIATQIKSDFLEYLKSLNLSKQQTECLENRIKKNIILTKEQIKPETVRLEILEADGMNFHGKVHLIENAINHSDMLEITIPSEENPSKMEKFFGKPIFIARQTNDSLLKMQLNNSEETKIFSVSRINYAKIIKTSLI